MPTSDSSCAWQLRNRKFSWAMTITYWCRPLHTSVAELDHPFVSGLQLLKSCCSTWNQNQNAQADLFPNKNSRLKGTKQTARQQKRSEPHAVGAFFSRLRLPILNAFMKRKITENLWRRRWVLPILSLIFWKKNAPPWSLVLTSR